MIAHITPPCEDARIIGRLITVDEALARIATVSLDLPSTDICITQAVGRVLTQDVQAQTCLPRFDNSAMDGFALRSSEVQPNKPIHISGEQPAGADTNVLYPNTVMRIFTGASIPVGADTVVPQEHVKVQAGQAIFSTAPTPGTHIRRAGEECAKGATLATSGIRVSTAHVAGFVAAGVSKVRVRQRPKVSLLLTGDELRPAGARLASGQIWDCNGPMLSAMMARLGLSPNTDQIADDRANLTTWLDTHLQTDHLIVTSGAASVGAHDHLQDVLQDLGATPVFKGVRMKPGKPVGLYQTGNCFILCLPGNPYAAYVTWALFGEALIAQLTGYQPQHPPHSLAQLEADIKNTSPRDDFRPAVLTINPKGQQTVTVQAATKSSMMRPMAMCNAFARIPANSALAAGQIITCFTPEGAAL